MRKGGNLFLCLLLVFLLGCGKTLDFNLQNVKEHDWMNTFVHLPINFSGSHNLDESIITFYFESKLSVHDYYNKVDSLALIEGWKRPFFSNDCRVYVREAYDQSTYLTPVIVKINSLESGAIVVEIR